MCFGISVYNFLNVTGLVHHLQAFLKIKFRLIGYESQVEDFGIRMFDFGFAPYLINAVR